MSARIIDGKKIAEKIRESFIPRIKSLCEKGVVPSLAAVLVGDNPASKIYVSRKAKAFENLALHSTTLRLPEDIPEEELLRHIEKLNLDHDVHGILVQLPLPGHINEHRIIEAISPEKDADGFHPVNVGKLVLNRDALLPCTPHGIVILLQESGVDPDGKHAVIVGRSNIVGKPILNLLLQKRKMGNATVTLCHTHTRNMESYTRQADILIAAAGRAEMITGDMLKDGVVVIDVGINRVEDKSRPKGYRLVGDVHYESVAEKASAITPVPGGVGPMTVTMLIHNTIKIAEMSTQNRRVE